MTVVLCIAGSPVLCCIVCIMRSPSSLLFHAVGPWFGSFHWIISCVVENRDFVNLWVGVCCFLSLLERFIPPCKLLISEISRVRVGCVPGSQRPREVASVTTSLWNGACRLRALGALLARSNHCRPSTPRDSRVRGALAFCVSSMRVFRSMFSW